MDKPRRCWFHFSLRTLLVLLTLAGAAAGWLGVQFNWIQDRHAMLEHSHVAACGFQLGYSTAPWGLWLLGETGVGEIALWMTNDSAADEERLKATQRLFPEARVTMQLLPTVPLVE